MADVLDLSKLLRGTLAVVATLLVALLLAGAFVVSVVTQLASSLSPSWPGSGSAVGSAATGEIPAAYLAMMRQASAASCGLPWEVLAAVAKVESGFDPRAVGPFLPQFAGTEDEHALGLMQFLPSTYRGLIPRVDAATGQGLGPGGIWDAQSSIFAGAFYLCDSGADRSDLRAALYTYNRADWYVDQVLAQAATYGLGAGGTIGGSEGGAGSDAVALARQFLGWPYAWGGADPSTSFDCSGLVQWVYGQLGVRLPRTAQGQYNVTAQVDQADLRPGDLLFFAQTYPDPNDWITHVGMYVGNGRMLTAPQEGDVIKEAPAFTGFWGDHYVGAGRVGTSR